MARFYTLRDGGLRLTVRAKPGVSRPLPPRVVDVGDGKQALEVAVHATAVDGMANEAVKKALAEFLGVKKADVCLAVGTTSRLKQFDIAGNPAKLEVLLLARIKA